MEQGDKKEKKYKVKRILAKIVTQDKKDAEGVNSGLSDVPERIMITQD